MPGRRRDLDRAPHLVADLLMINLAGVAHLHKQVLPPAGDGAERNDHILKRHRHGAFQNLFEQLATLAQPQLVDQQLHQIAMARVANGLVVQFADLAIQRIAQRAQAAAGVEGFVAHAVERELLEPFQRQYIRSAGPRGSLRTDCSTR